MPSSRKMRRRSPLPTKSTSVGCVLLSVPIGLAPKGTNTASSPRVSRKKRVVTAEQEGCGRDRQLVLDEEDELAPPPVEVAGVGVVEEEAGLRLVGQPARQLRVEELVDEADDEDVAWLFARDQLAQVVSDELRQEVEGVAVRSPVAQLGAGRMGAIERAARGLQAVEMRRGDTQFGQGFANLAAERDAADAVEDEDLAHAARDSALRAAGRRRRRRRASRSRRESRAGSGAGRPRRRVPSRGASGTSVPLPVDGDDRHAEKGREMAVARVVGDHGAGFVEVGRQFPISWNTGVSSGCPASSASVRGSPERRRSSVRRPASAACGTA